MSKPGGKPILKERAFFEDQVFAVFGQSENGKIIRWTFLDKTSNVRKEFPVKNDLIKEAFQKMEKYADEVTHKLLEKVGGKIKGPTRSDYKRPGNGGHRKRKHL